MMSLRGLGNLGRSRNTFYLLRSLRHGGKRNKIFKITKILPAGVY